MASFPTPSVLRGWSDEMEAGEGEYSPPTQTPQCIRDALQLTLDAAGGAAEHVDLQQQAFQEGCSPPQPEQTPASAANRVCAWEEDGRQQAGAAGATLRTPAALRDWTDDETDIGEEPSPNNAVDDPAEEAEGKEAPPFDPIAGRHMGWSGLTQLDPAAIKIARPRAAAPALPAGADAAGGGVVALKLLQRPPRNNCVAFAEAVHIPELGLQLSSKDKKTAAALRRPPGAGAEGGAGGAGEEPALAEPCTFYRVPSGAWFLEFHRYFTAAQAEAAAAAAGCRLALPAGFDRSMELVKSVEREYAPLADVVGGQAVKKVKTSGGAPMLSLRGSRSRSYFWRWALDPRTGRLLTDQPASDFLLGE
eukprot:scaffold2.g7346.t1